MKLLFGLLLVSAAAARYTNDQNYGYSSNDGQGRSYDYSQTSHQSPGVNVVRQDSNYVDSSVNRQGADFSGAHNYNIGHTNGGKPVCQKSWWQFWKSCPKNIRGKRDVEESAIQDESALSRQKRGYYSADVYYSNDHRTDSSINMNGAQFQRANNFNIGHRGKRDVEVEEKENKLDQEVSRQKRGSYSANVHYTSDHRHDESINMNGAKFQGAHHFEIGHQRGKRDVETEQMNGEEQVVPREKRQYFNADVHLQNHYAHDESINMNGAQFQGANNFNIGHKRGKRDVETAEVQPSEQELSRQKRGYYNADVYYSNDHRTDKSINMERSQFTGAHHFNIGHKEKRSVGEEQTAEQELTRQKRGYFSADVSYSNQYKHDASINLNDAKFQGAHDFNIGHRSKRESEPEEKKDKTDKSETEKADKHLYREKRRMDWGSKGSVDMSYNLQGSNFQGAHHFEITRGRTRVFDV